MTTSRRGFLQGLTVVAVAPLRAQSTSRRTIALLFDSLIAPFWVAAIETFRRQAAMRAWSVLEAVSNMDDNHQYTQVISMIERGVDGIVIVHTDAKAVIPAIRAANAAGVPMIHFNRAPAPNDAYSVAVVADNRKLMDDTVSALIKIARREPKRYRAAVLLGDLKDANGASRRDGFNDAISRHGDLIEVVGRIATEWNADKAFAGLSTVLQAHPDIDLLVSASDFLTPQIEQALRVAGKWHPSGSLGHVLIAGFDGDDNGYRQLAGGYYDVDGVQNLDFEVELTLKALERLWAGERIPRLLIDPGFVISRDNLGEKRGEMWGYRAWAAKATLAAPGTIAAPLAGAPAGAPHPDSLTGGGLHPDSSVTGLLGLTALAGLANLLSLATLHDVLIAMLPLAILVAGQMLVLLIGQIDLSMTAVMALGSIFGASVMTRGPPGLGSSGLTMAGIAIFLLIGAAIGIFNGICNAIFRVPSFIVTLAVMMAGSGAAVWYAASVSDTISIGGLPSAFRALGYGTLAGTPIALLLSVAVLATLHGVLTRTVFGRWIYALGHNREAARISGVPVRHVTIAAFTASSLCASLAAIIYTSRLETGLPTLGQNMLLDIVGAAVIGGVSLFGGRGNILMVLGGVAFLSVLDKSLQLLGLSLFVVLAVKGVAILVAAILDAARTAQARGEG